MASGKVSKAWSIATVFWRQAPVLAVIGAGVSAPAQRGGISRGETTIERGRRRCFEPGLGERLMMSEVRIVTPAK